MALKIENFEVKFGDFATNVATLAETESLSRLLTLGFSTALKNSHAGLEAALRKENPDISDEEVKAEILAKLQAKFDAIVAGEWNRRESNGASGLTSFDRTVNKVAQEAFRAMWKSHPKLRDVSFVAKGTDAEKSAHLAYRDAIFAKFATEARKAEWAAEATRRLATVTPDAADDFDFDV